MPGPRDRPTGSRPSSGKAPSQRAQPQRSRATDDIRKKNLEDGSLTARADQLGGGGGDGSGGHYHDEGYDVIAYIGCMLNNGRALAKANASDGEFSTDAEVASVKVC